MSKIPPLMVVLHETVVDLQTIKELHGDPQFLGSYHIIIDRFGGIHRMVPTEFKAFAAANSAFTNPYTGVVEEINGSVDDFAVHIALETPPDGRDPDKAEHTGYTYEQYDSCAWMLHRLGVDILRVATHGQIRIPTTKEPRCLNTTFLFELYNTKSNVAMAENIGVLTREDETAVLDDLEVIVPRVQDRDLDLGAKPS